MLKKTACLLAVCLVLLAGGCSFPGQRGSPKTALPQAPSGQNTTSSNNGVGSPGRPQSSSQTTGLHPGGWVCFIGKVPGSNGGFLGLFNPRTDSEQHVAAPIYSWLAPQSGRVLLGSFSYYQKGRIAQADGAAVSWDPTSGAVQPWSLHFSVPCEGSMFVEDMDTACAVSGPESFALYHFHGGSVGEVYSFYTPDFKIDPAYSSPNPPPGSPVYFGQQFSAIPPVLACSPDGTWLLRGATPYQSGPDYAYGLLFPGGRIQMDAALNTWHRKAKAAAFSPGGRYLVLLTDNGGLWLVSGSGQPILVARIPIPPYPIGVGAGPPRLPRAEVSWSPGGRYLLAGFGRHLQLLQFTGANVSFMRSIELPAGTSQWAWISGTNVVLPNSAALQGAGAELGRLAATAAVLVPSPAGVAPQVAVHFTTTAGEVSLPVDRWKDGTGDSQWCLVSRGPHPGAFSGLSMAAQDNWVVLPAHGWLEHGRYTVTVSWPGGSVIRQIDL